MSFYQNEQADKYRIKELTEQIFKELEPKLFDEHLTSIKQKLNSIRLINGIDEVV